MEVGEKIKELRKAHGLTQQGLADLMSTEEASVAASAINRYETGKVNPKLETQIKLAKIFGMSLQAFINYGERELDRTLIDRFEEIVSTYVFYAAYLDEHQKMNNALFEELNKRPLTEEQLHYRPTNREQQTVDFLTHVLDLAEEALERMLPDAKTDGVFLGSDKK